MAAVRAWGTAQFEGSVVALAATGARGDDVAVGRLDALVAAAWGDGWGPADLAHVVGRELTDAHVAAVAGRIVADLERRLGAGEQVVARWRGEVEDLVVIGAGVDAALEVAVALVAIMLRLGSVPPTMPRPGESSGVDRRAMSRLDPRMLGRVRALLAKAESTDFEEEASAFMAKAQELIARHAIDEALLRADRDDIGEPSLRRFHLDDPYLDAKTHLVAEVADANRCRVVQQTQLGWVTAFGYDGDLDAVELLVASLLAQGTAAMLRAGTVRDAAGRSRTRSFRRAFLFGFGQRIGQRLRAATDEQVADASTTSSALVPVLAEQQSRVEAATSEAFPEIVRKRSTMSNGAGFAAGRTAGDRANLDPATPLRPSGG